MPNGWEKLIGQTIADIRGNGNEVSFYNKKGEKIMLILRTSTLFDGHGMIFDLDSLPDGEPASEDEVNRKIIIDSLANVNPDLTITLETKIADLGFDADDWETFLEAVEGSSSTEELAETVAYYPVVDLEAFETVNDLVESFVRMMATSDADEDIDDTDEDEDESED